MSGARNIEGSTYHIRVKGRLDPKWAGWFEGFDLTAQVEDETLFHGEVADQAELHGVLDKINNLGLTLTLIAKVDDLVAGQRCPLCGQMINFTKEI